jgi:DNA polymerase V
MGTASPTSVTLFALVDCNNFYVSCERAFDPHLLGRPVVVLSNNDGCVVSRSQEAKALSIKMGVPWFEIKHLEQEAGLIARSSNYALYGSVSARVMGIIGALAPQQEIYSIDECFLDFTGIANPEQLGHAIRARTIQWAHIPVCVGIASTKTRAKLANHVAKKVLRLKGVFNLERLTQAQQDGLLGKLDVNEVWGVGNRLRSRLEKIGITTVRALRDADTEHIRTHLGVVMARTVMELQGVSCISLEEVTPQKKQIMNSRSFGKLVTSLDELREAVASHAARASEKLRREGSAATGVHVFVQSNPFREGDRQYQASRFMPLATATADTRRITAAALLGLEDMFVAGINYKKAGVMLCDLVDHTVQQSDLFSASDAPEAGRLMNVVDHLNRRFGAGTAVFAGAGLRKDWAMRSDMRSQGFTTRWDELPVAHAH